MSDAWIYGEGASEASSRLLGEIGFTPHRVWGHDFYGGARTIDVHVRRIRGKLGGEFAARIKTVRSVGYRWEEP